MSADILEWPNLNRPAVFLQPYEGKRAYLRGAQRQRVSSYHRTFGRCCLPAVRGL